MSYNLGPPPAEGDVNRGPALRNVTIVSFTIVVFALVLRMYSRRCIVRQVGWDDYTIIAATVKFTLLSYVQLRANAKTGYRSCQYCLRP